jgi:hypothetical protein
MKAKFTPAVRAKKTPAEELEDIGNESELPTAPKTRNTVDPSVLVARALTGNKPVNDDAEPEPTVKVNIPRTFKLTDDNHVIHQYNAGPNQDIPVSHAEHFYSIANGVVKTEE